MVSADRLTLEPSIKIATNVIASLCLVTLIPSPTVYVRPRVEDSFVELAKNDNLVKIKLQRNPLFSYSVVRLFGWGMELKNRGTVSVKREPCPTWLDTATVPPICSITCFTMDRPRPVPPISRDRALSTR